MNTLRFTVFVWFLGLSSLLGQTNNQQPMLVDTGSAPFMLTATTTSGPALTITATSSNLTDFTGNLIKSQGQFQALNGQSFIASIIFLGVPNAITFVSNANATNVNFILTPTGFSKTFIGSSSSDVNTQIENFIKSDGAAVYADFLRAIARQSVVAVTDGNPTAATAIAANSTFGSQGFTPADELVSSADGTSEKPRYGGFGLGFNSGQFNAGGFKGSNTDISFTGLNLGITDKVRLVIPVSLSYLTLAGAKVAGAGLSLALPIRLRTMDKEHPFNWRVTPLVGLSVRASADLASGTLLWQLGAVNTIDYRVNPKLVICLVNQLTMFRSIAVNYGGYSFDAKIDQQIMKNGLRLVTPLTRRLIGDIMVIDTRFLKDAAVKQFTTIGGSLSFRATKTYNVALGANYDTGNNFKAWSVGLSSAWRW